MVKSKFFIYIPILLLIATLNPLVLSYIRVTPVALMLAHYSLFASGLLLGYGLLKGSKFGLIGVIPAIVFHYPELFVLSAINPFVTAIDFTFMFLGGLLLGSSLKAIGYWLKVTLFVLYMIGDTALAVLFVAYFPIYSPPAVPFSPYTTGEFVLLGYIMFAIMNGILAYVMVDILRKLLL
ncbi:MAG: DUF1404 family protein [Sulfolobaceae archaeon]|nr:DUF1404 family protein [Sulfolobaceae archaeon]